LEATLGQQQVELEKLERRLRDLDGGSQAARIQGSWTGIRKK